MVTVKSIIQNLQNYDPNETVEDLLEKPEFVSRIKESFNLLPKPSRVAASKIVRNRRQPGKQKKPSDKALNAILSVETICLPTKAQEKYNECKQCPSKFWVWAGIRLDLETDSTKPIDTFLCAAYVGITGLETQRQWDTIIWRFFVLFFHDLVNSFGRTYLTSAFEDELVLILSSSSLVTDTAENIRGNLKRWVACGSRYAQLSKSLGNGAPFLLPQSVTDKTWETGLPLGGASYKRAIKHLVAKGFCEESKAIGADILGTKIREEIVKPFKWNVSAFKLNTISGTSHAVRVRTVHENGGLGVYGNSATEQSSLTASSPLYNVSQTGHPQDGRASIDLLYQAAIQANTSMQTFGEGQSNVPEPSHDHSMSTQPGLTVAEASPGLTGTAFAQSTNLMDQDSGNIWGSTEYVSAQTPWSNAVDIPPPNQTIPLDIWNNAVDIPPPNQTIPLDIWNNAINIPPPNQSIPFDIWNNAVDIPPQNHARSLDSSSNTIHIPAQPSTCYPWQTLVATGP